MKLCERVAFISKNNMKRLKRLYGEIGIGGLSRVVNNHLQAAMDEIEEDCMYAAGKNKDLIQLNTDILFTGKDGKVIEIKVPEPEYMIDSIW